MQSCCGEQDGASRDRMEKGRAACLIITPWDCPVRDRCSIKRPLPGRSMHSCQQRCEWKKRHLPAGHPWDEGRQMSSFLKAMNLTTLTTHFEFLLRPAPLSLCLPEPIKERKKKKNMQKPIAVGLRLHRGLKWDSSAYLRKAKLNGLLGILA